MLLKLAKSPIELLRIDGAAHGNIHEFPAYLDGMEAKLLQLAAR
jgi:hypothetical protein